MKSKRGSIQSYGSIPNVEGYEPIPDGSDYEEDEDLNGNCKLKILSDFRKSGGRLNTWSSMHFPVHLSLRTRSHGPLSEFARPHWKKL